MSLDIMLKNIPVLVKQKHQKQEGQLTLYRKPLSLLPIKTMGWLMLMRAEAVDLSLVPSPAYTESDLINEIEGDKLAWNLNVDDRVLSYYVRSDDFHDRPAIHEVVNTLDDAASV